METVNKKKTIRKDELVYVMSGNSRGMTGKVLRVLGDKVIVQGVNLRKKHVKPTRDQKGSIVTMEKPVHISNLSPARESSKN